VCRGLFSSEAQITETTMSNDLECPYCEKWNEVCHDDGQGYEEGKNHEMQCAHCRKNFVFQTAISYDYAPEKADCLNGSPHNFRDWNRLWEQAGEVLEQRHCKDCDYRERRKRPATNKEER